MRQQKKYGKIYKFFFLFSGLISTLWFLIRVIPKPSRASYPCMRAVSPLMSTFITYLLGLLASFFAFYQTKKRFINSKYFSAFVFLLVFLISIIFSLSRNEIPVYANAPNLIGPNQPVGDAQGIFPGRVVWVWDEDLTNENCSNEFGDAWYQEENLDLTLAVNMFNESILRLTGKLTVKEAWDTLFQNFNIQKGKGNFSYQDGEKIFIKANIVSASSSTLNDDFSVKDTRRYGMAESSPQIVLALLRQLVNGYGVPQENISLGDPSKNIYKHSYDLWSNEFPNVNYISKESGYGRNSPIPSQNPLIHYSDQGEVLRTSEGAIVYNDHFPTVIEEADYLINIGALKAHNRAAITLLAKNHFGSHCRNNANHLHNGLVGPGKTPTRTDYGMYRIQVDLMGSSYLGRNTVLNIIDGTYGGSEANDPPRKFQMDPFNNDWTSSILISQDQVALESVCFDILKTEFTEDNPYASWPQYPAADDYLLQAADSSFWPENVVYDPDNSGEPIPSLGVHEHWNNEIERKYSKNLGEEQGIELVYVNYNEEKKDAQSSLVSFDGSQLIYSPYANENETNSENVIPDFSYCGFQMNKTEIPDVPIVIELEPVEGDNRQQIQSAIDSVASLPMNENGFRGAILLKKGDYEIDGSLSIETNGIVLKGESQKYDGTVLIAISNQDENLISLQGNAMENELLLDTKTHITDPFVPTGTMSFSVASGSPYQAGDTIVMIRNSNENWIEDIGMQNSGWLPNDFLFESERIITAINGNQITINLPVVDPFQTVYGGGEICKITGSEKISFCGIENLRIETGNENNPIDHAIYLDGVENSWVRNVTVRHFASSCVSITNSSFNTIQNCAMLDPLTQDGQEVESAFNIKNGFGNLIQRCFSRGCTNDFIVDDKVCGPNVFLDCFSLNSDGESGPQGNWSTGILYDNIRTASMGVSNQADETPAGGWQGSQIVFWNCIADSGEFVVQSPVGGKNFAVGCKSMFFQGNGYWESQGLPVQPRSLYIQQLIDRKGLSIARSMIHEKQFLDTIWNDLAQWHGEGELFRHQECFLDTLPSLFDKIEAENYDLGENHLSYLDLSSGNHGGSYRDDDVDIVQQENDYFVSVIDSGEWLEYSVQAFEGVYPLEIRYSAIDSQNSISVFFDGDSIGNIDLPATGASEYLKSKIFEGFKIPRNGSAIIRLVFHTQSDLSFDWFGFNQFSQSAYHGEPTVLPARIEAENYDFGGEGISYHDLTSGSNSYRRDDVDIFSNSFEGGYVVSSIEDQEWLEYTVSIPAGSYKVDFRISTEDTTRSIQVSSDSYDLGRIQLPSTGGWLFYQTHTLDSIVIPTSGVQTIRLTFSGEGDMNFNWFEFISNSTAIDEKNMNGNRFYLKQNYPNPFHNSTTIDFNIPGFEKYELSIFNLAGQKVFSKKGMSDGNPQSLQLDIHEMASGIYYYQLKSANKKSTRKMLLIK